MEPSTRCVHGGRTPPAVFEPLVLPVVRSSIYRLGDETYRLRAAGRGPETRVYSRETNPTVEAVEARLAALEGAERSLLFASGQAALHSVLLAFLARGDRVLAARQLYGGSTSLLQNLVPRLGVALVELEFADLAALRAAADERTRLVLCENVSNPLTAVADVPAIAAIAHAQPRALLVVDATLTSPIGQQPLALGADLVFHSATEYLGGHSDLIGGLVSARRELAEACWAWRARAGGCIDPQVAWLIERGLKTLALRFFRQSASARQVAEFLAGHAEIEAVHYCGLPSHPDHEKATRLLAACGGLLSAVVRGGDERALAVMRRLELFAEAASLGGVESLVCRPSDMSHSYLTPAERAAMGIRPGLLRFALGIEDASDLVADLAQALAATRA
ncbi:MAG: aminotransferase class I/II-fold pyridoxal phosphate-dependent enzyme [Planctomycetota bacterium]